MNITVIGTNAAGIATVCNLMQRNLAVRLYTTDEKLRKLWKDHPVTVKGTITGDFHMPLISDAKEAMDFADVVEIVAPATEYENILSEIRPHLHAGQSILFFGGFGALKMYRVTGEKEMMHLTIGEVGTYPCPADLSEDYLTLNVHVDRGTAFYAAIGESETLDCYMNEIVERVQKEDSVLETSLGDAEPLLRTMIAIDRLKKLEAGESQASLPSDDVLNRLREADEEKLKLGKSMGLALKPLYKWLGLAENHMGNRELGEALCHNAALCVLEKPKEFWLNELYENTAPGPGAVLDMAREKGIDVPATEAIVKEAFWLMNKAYKPYLKKEDMETMKVIEEM